MMPSGICYNLNHLLFRNKRWIKYLGSFSPFILTSKYTPLLFFTCVLFFFCIEFIDALFKSFKKLKKNQPSLIQILMVLIIIYSFSIPTWSFKFNFHCRQIPISKNKKSPENLISWAFHHFLNGARKGTWTLTGNTSNRPLKPARLPIPPSSHICRFIRQDLLYLFSRHFASTF